MILHYLPASDIIIDEVRLSFSEKRHSVRKKLGETYKEDNQIVSLADKDIHQRRDIYKNLHDTDNYFFMGYNEDDLLIEVEVHQCDQIKVMNMSFDFNEALDAIALKLAGHSPGQKRGEGEYFFKDLKIAIIDKEQMGGEGNTLGYFYCTNDVSHLDSYK